MNTVTFIMEEMNFLIEEIEAQDTWSYIESIHFFQKRFVLQTQINHLIGQGGICKDDWKIVVNIWRVREETKKWNWVNTFASVMQKERFWSIYFSEVGIEPSQMQGRIIKC